MSVSACVNVRVSVTVCVCTQVVIHKLFLHACIESLLKSTFKQICNDIRRIMIKLVLHVVP